MWTGSSTGIIYVTQDGGASWSDVTPAAIPAMSLVGVVEASHFDPATAYAEVERSNSGDEKPYLYRTRDYGKTWQSIVNGLPAMGWILTKVLRENSAFMFQWLPWLFDFQYMLFMYFAPTRWFSRKLLSWLGARGLMRLICAHDPDVIVSTYPGVTAVLGELRRRGSLPTSGPT